MNQSNTHVARNCPCCGCKDYVTVRVVDAERFYRERAGINEATIVKCDDCSMEFTNPVLNAELDAMQYYELEGYKAAFPSNPDKLVREDDYVVFCELSQQFKNQKCCRVLDFGCGRGGFVHYCQKHSYDAHGLELNEKTVYGATALGIQNVRAQRIEEQPTSSYDVVTAIHVLEHMTDCAAIIKQFARVLKPGGLAIVIMPNYHSTRFRISPKSYWNAPYQHLNAMNEPSLTKAFTKNGFEKIPLKILPNDPNLLISMKKKISVALARSSANLFNFYPTKLLLSYRKK
jgi:SAM-dependent methyltransferase